MPRHREVIERFHVGHGIPQLLILGQVLNQRLRVAGDVDDLVHAVAGDLLHGFPGHADPGRVHYDDVRLFLPFLQNPEDVAADEFAIGESVQGGVGAGRLHAFRNDLHAENVFGGTGQNLGDCSCAAVEVEDVFSVDIVDQGVGYTLVRASKSAEGSAILRAGDEVVVTASDIEPGKVIE